MLQPAIAGVADVDRGNEFTRQLLGAIVGLGTFALPARMVLRSARWRIV
jgi:hypothetical protein